MLLDSHALTPGYSIVLASCFHKMRDIVPYDTRLSNYIQIPNFKYNFLAPQLCISVKYEIAPFQKEILKVTYYFI